MPAEAVDIKGLGRSIAAQPFWDALAEGRLQLPHCRRCGRPFFFPRRWCPVCHSDELGWVESAGRGVIYAVSVVHVPFDGRPESEVPYAVVLVDLDDGVRIPGRMDDADLTAVIGDQVQLHFAADPAHHLPVFRLSARTGRGIAGG